MMNIDNIVGLKSYKKIYIYGAGKVAYDLYSYFKLNNIKIEAFIVSSMGNNQSELDGVNVRLLNDSDIDDNNVFWVGVSQLYANDIIELLKSKGCKNIIYPITDIINLLKKNYIISFIAKYGYSVLAPEFNEQAYMYLVQNNCIFRILINDFSKETYNQYFENTTLLETFERLYNTYNLVPESDNDNTNTIAIYMTKCHLDKEINNVNDGKYIVPIQAGADLTEKKICDITDNTGDNISVKNCNYCECSVIYWIWKNALKLHDYVGLCHYRRRFELSDNQLTHLKDSHIDIVVSMPTLILPSICEHFIINGKTREEWQVMMDGIKFLYPDYYQTAQIFDNQNLICQCNISIMRSDIFDKYCSFLFSVLEYIESENNKVNPDRQDRYLGYYAENLTSIFVMHNKDKYKIAYSYINYIGMNN